jgi:gamma-glutamyl phosphate reductase
VIKGENWEQVYLSQKLDLPILSTVDEAIEWTNNLIHEIDVSL